MLSPKVKLREFRMEDQPDPGQSSSFYRRHLEYFNIHPEGQTIRAVVIQLKARVRESFIRKCHYLPEAYDFRDFRLTRTYRLYRELITYLSKLSSWLYRGGKIPPSLKKAFSRSHTFVNPYVDFSLGEIAVEDLPQLNNLMLTVAYNLNICNRFPDENFRKSILREMKRRKIPLPELENTRDVLIEVIKTGKQEQVIFLQADMPE